MPKPSPSSTPSVEPRFIRACRGEPVDRTPVWILRQAGRYLPQYRAVRENVSFLDLCKTPELAAKVTLDAATALGVDAAIIFSDILIPLEAMGAPIVYGDEGPKLPAPVRTREAAARLHGFDPARETRFLGESIRLVCRALPPDVPLIGFAGAPFTLFAYLVEGGGSKNYETTKRLMLEAPDLAHHLLHRLADAIAPYLSAQASAGARALLLFDTWAGMLSPHDFDAFVVPATERLLAKLDRGGCPVAYFALDSAGLLERIARLRIDVVGLDWRVDLGEARTRLGPKLAVQGNLDPCVLFGPRSSVEARVREILAINAGRPGHVFNLGHGILPHTPVENALALVDAVKKYRSS
ncbi:MAG: uroporphyrinogen decarboxylase [Planctomycetes bacterium]|nr:uroporphyrinogen decarboxylase [Planctomycetota bacterium]